VLGVRQVAGAYVTPRIELLVELAVGAATYVVSALVIARATAKDLLVLVRGAIARRRGGGGRDARDSLASLPPPSEQ
jgi:hypothetical protein